MVKYKFLLRKYLDSLVITSGENAFVQDTEKENIYGIKEFRYRVTPRNMKEASWRAACDKWVSNFLEDRKGATTPIYQLYNSYIENNPNNYMDIGQFGKVLRSWFPYRKRRRGKQGAQIYVYQDVALKTRMTSRPRHMRKIGPDPTSSTLHRSYSRGGPAKSFNLLNTRQPGPLSVPSMMVGNHKVGSILVSIPEVACTASSTTGLENRPECTASLSTSKAKRKYVEESSSMSSFTRKKTKVSDKEEHQLSNSTDDSTLLMKNEIKNEIEFEEESCLPLDHFLTEVPSSQPLVSDEKQKENGTVPTSSSEPATTKSRGRRRRPPQISYKERMALARQWVDANLIDRKGVTTSASVFFEAYIHDNPVKPLPQNSLAVVIRGKFPTRRKPVKQDSKIDYYYQDLELVKHNDIPMFPSSLEATTYGSAPFQVGTNQPVVNDKKNKKSEAACSAKKNIITTQESRPDITAHLEGMEDIIVKRKKETPATVTSKRKRASSSKVTSEKRGRSPLITRSRNRKLLSEAGNKEEKLSTTEGKEKENPTNTERKEEERQSIEVERTEINPVIFTDTDGGIPVAVANPPSESVFSYHGVPCVMIPISNTSNILHAQDPTQLAAAEGKAVVSPLAKMISSVSQNVIDSDEARKEFQNIPSSSQAVKNVTTTPHVISDKSINMKDNLTDSTQPSYPVLQGKIQIKTVASINATDISSVADKEKSETSTYFVGRESCVLSSSCTEKEKQNLANFEEKDGSVIHKSYRNKNSSEIKGPVDKNNDISCQSLNDTARATSPSLEHLPDMDVLDYIKSEMAEDDEFMNANMRMKPPQNFITKNFDNPEDAVKTTQNNNVFMCESQLMEHDRNITAEIISEHVTGVIDCESKIVQQSNTVEKTIRGYDDDDVQENAQNVTVTENRPMCVIAEVKGQVIEDNSTDNVSEHESVSIPENVENEVTEDENHIARESTNNHTDMFKITQLEGGVEKVMPDQSICKVLSSKKTARRWDEDIRSFVADSDTISRYKGPKIPRKRRKNKMKEKNLHQTVTECSLTPVNVSSKTPRNSELTNNTENEKNEPLSEDEETGILQIVHTEEITMSDRTCDKDDEHFEDNSKQTGEKVKRAVLNATFELLSEAGTMLTETERAQKLEAALFGENLAVHYDTRRAKTCKNMNNESLEDFPCIPSSALENLKSQISHGQSTQLLLHHQACPQLNCQKCSILRAAYVHITLLHHRCQIWHTFTKIVSRHSRGCRMAECPVLFCHYMKHELHLSGVSVLPNHLVDGSKQVEAEFTKCHRAGPHKAALHCSHQQDVRLPVPLMAQVRCQEQALSVEARGLKVMADLLMPDRPRAHDITTPILHTLGFAAAHCDHHAQAKSKD